MHIPSNTYYTYTNKYNVIDYIIIRSQKCCIYKSNLFKNQLKKSKEI